MKGRFESLDSRRFLDTYLQDSVQNGKIPVGAATCRPQATEDGRPCGFPVYPG